MNIQNVFAQLFSELNLFIKIVPLMFVQVCDIKFSELVPCLDRILIYQLKLKPNLTIMEHYERHCPPPERRYNCLIPPPIGYKVCDCYRSCKFHFDFGFS